MSKTPKTSKKKAASAPEGETKEGKFSRLASKRVTVAVKKISLIGNLAGSGYAYTPEQVEKIKAVLSEAVKSVLSRFDKTAKAEAEAIQI